MKAEVIAVLSTVGLIGLVSYLIYKQVKKLDIFNILSKSVETPEIKIPEKPKIEIPIIKHRDDIGSNYV